jgi:outer membrane protein TolC
MFVEAGRNPPEIDLTDLLATVIVAMMLFTGAAVSAAPLTLGEAEQLARSSDPLNAAFTERQRAMELSAEVADAWPDPQLRFGVMNLPVDRFSLSQEPMTQSVIGLRQMFPRASETAAQREVLLRLGGSIGAEAEDRAAMVTRQVRDLWAELAHQRAVAQELADSRQLFDGLAEISHASYAVGRRGQQDVLRADLELARLGEREARVDQRDRELRAMLAGLIGDRALGELGLELDSMSGSSVYMNPTALDQHPKVRALDARMASAGAEVSAADARSGPRWSVDLAYGVRGGSNTAGGSRPDLLSAMVSVDLPLFGDRRQRGERDAATARRMALLADRAELIRRMRAEADGLMQTQQRTDERLSVYRNLLTIGEQRAEATLTAYRNDSADFDEVMRAHIALLDLRIERERLRADLALARNALAYLMTGATEIGAPIAAHGGDDDV